MNTNSIHQGEKMEALVENRAKLGISKPKVTVEIKM